MPHVGDIASLDVPDRIRREGSEVFALILNKKYKVSFSYKLPPRAVFDTPFNNDWAVVPEGLFLYVLSDDSLREAKLCLVTSYEIVRKQILLNLDDGSNILRDGYSRWKKVNNGKHGLFCKKEFTSYVEFIRFEDLTCDALKTYEKLTGDYDPEGLPF